jgi:transposase-like protein
MPQAMKILFNEAMLIERTQHLGVGHYERSNNRLDYANGYKPKRVKTRIGIKSRVKGFLRVGIGVILDWFF